MRLLQFFAFTLVSSLALAIDNPTSNRDWWPDSLDLRPLRQQSSDSDPMGAAFAYQDAFRTLDLSAVKKDIAEVLHTSQPWWPADYGTYGPFFIRMAWHSAGVYRIYDGRGGASGGQQRFEPLNSWPDNTNLDKARRLLWPIKKKYGARLSWADLMVLAGNVALEDMGFKTLGFGGGRTDDFEAEIVNWGHEKKFLADERHDAKGELAKPLAAVEMGLIYANPEGPGGKPDPLLAAQEIRVTFGRMAMNDEETVALIAGGHTFGKAHGAHKPDDCLGPEPAAGGLEQQGLGWLNHCGSGNGKDTVTSGLEGAWSANPTRWTHEYLTWLYAFDWELTKSPAGGQQWTPKNGQGATLVPDAHDGSSRHPPIMFTTDLALKMDPEYQKISKRFLENPPLLEAAFARAWFKLTHRDMGPRVRYVGTEVPKEEFTWQDPLPPNTFKPLDSKDLEKLKTQILSSGIAIPDLVRTAWASAATFRETDYRGGANGARIRLLPEKDWMVNDPDQLHQTLTQLEAIRTSFNGSLAKTGKGISLADLIVLGGGAAIESAAKQGGLTVTVPFLPGRTDASQEQTDVESFRVLEPKWDGFRNYFDSNEPGSPPERLIERARYLSLTVPEMTVLIGGLRALNTNSARNPQGVLTLRPGILSNDFFVNLLDTSTEWRKSSSAGVYEGYDRASGTLRWTASPVDLVFGSHSELRAVAEVYAADDAKEKFADAFIKAWVKVMNLDRFDQRSEKPGSKRL